MTFGWAFIDLNPSFLGTARQFRLNFSRSGPLAVLAFVLHKISAAMPVFLRSKAPIRLIIQSQ
jgi:hypothetical protein